MPKGDPQGRMHGFQLWANLPSSLKMTAPRYQDVLSRDVPEVTDDDGTKVRIICGDFWGRRGPVDGIAADPRYLDVSVPPGQRKTLPVEMGRHGFAYVFEGSGSFRDASAPQGVLHGSDRWLRRFSASRRATVPSCCSIAVTRWSVQAGDEGIRFLLVSGKPIEEPVAWHGPIVMNTQAEIRQAMSDLRNGTFILNRNCAQGHIRPALKTRRARLGSDDRLRPPRADYPAPRAEDRARLCERRVALRAQLIFDALARYSAPIPKYVRSFSSSNLASASGSRVASEAAKPHRKLIGMEKIAGFRHGKMAAG